MDGEKIVKTKKSLQTWKSFPNNGNDSFKNTHRSKKWTKNMYSDILQIDGNPLPKLPEEEKAVGIITMEDVIEELLQVKYILIIMCLSYLKFSNFLTLYDGLLLAGRDI